MASGPSPRREQPPSRRNGACGPLRRRDGHTSRLVLLRRGRRAPEQSSPAPKRGDGRPLRRPADAAGPSRRRHRWPARLLLDAAVLRRALVRELAQGERAQGLQPRGLLDRQRVRHPGRRAVLRAAGPGRRRVAAGPADQHLRLPRAGRVPAQAGPRPRRAGGDEGRPAGAADGARVPPRRARLHRRAHPHRARGRGRGGQRRDHGDRRRRCRCSWPPTSSTRRAPRRSSSTRSTTPRSAARRSRPRASCPGSSG